MENTSPARIEGSADGQKVHLLIDTPLMERSGSVGMLELNCRQAIDIGWRLIHMAGAQHRAAGYGE